jgi:hypothetical protein
MTDSEKIQRTFEQEFSNAWKELGVKHVDYLEDGFGFTYNGQYVRIILVLHDPQISISVTVRKLKKVIVVHKRKK